ncbi:B3/4 domain-containing protein [candidate division KSB1 bacterium]
MIAVENRIFERTPGYKVGYLELKSVVIRDSGGEFWKKFDEEIVKIRNEYELTKIGEDRAISGMRKLYKGWKIDYTRYRPSSERLLRRTLKGNDLYRVNTVVDVCNYISLLYKLPIGLYDRDKAVGEITVRYGVEGDSYMGITGLDISAGGKVVVYDGKGPVGSPATDSKRTALDNGSTNIVCLFHCPENIEEEYLDRMMTDFYENLVSLQKNQPEIIDRGIIKAEPQGL